MNHPSSLFKYFLSVSILCFSLQLHSVPRVSLITCGAGEDLYSIFGHTALRLTDSTEGYDIVFNYGMFSYNTENFFYKFVKGETYYWLGAEHYEDFIWDYQRDGRAVYESPLLISDADAIKIHDFLAKNILPENKVYLYSFMFDNCATRVRDLVAQSVGDTVIWQPEGKATQPMPAGIARPDFFDSLGAGKAYTYRDLLNLYLHKIPWVEWGIFYSVAAPSDKQIPYVHSMFLPEFLLMGFQNAQYIHNETGSDLVGSPVQLIAPKHIDEDSAGVFSPMMVFVLLLIITLLLSYIGWRKARVLWGIDVVLFILLGLYGCAGFFVSFISIHPATFPNYNLLWAGPWHLIVGLALFVPYFRRQMLTKTAYFLLSALSLYFVAVLFQLQAIHLANIPLIAAFAVRYYSWIRVSK